MKVLIKSAKIIDAANSFHQKNRDILIENGKIAAIESEIKTEADQIITHPDLHISLGWFDSSVCFGEPGFEERETLENGLQTAARSGFTAIALNSDMHPNTDHHGAVSYLKSKSQNSATHLYPIGTLTQDGKGKDLAEIYDMSLAGAIAFGDYKKPIKDPNLLKIALQYAQGFGALIQTFPHEEALAKNAMVHEGEVSTKMGLKGMPAFAEELQLNRDLEILAYTGGKMHIPTISTAGSVRRIAEAKEKGLDITCGVALSNLFYTDEKLREFDAAYKVLPPLRTEKDRQALLEGVRSGVIDLVTSDHCPMNIELKKLEFEHAAYGTGGLETAFGVLNTLFGLEKAVELLTKGRERFQIEKPSLEKGNRAEISLFIPNEEYLVCEKDILSQSKNNMFIGVSLKGKALGCFSNNRLIWNHE